MLKNIVN